LSYDFYFDTPLGEKGKRFAEVISEEMGCCFGQDMILIKELDGKIEIFSVFVPVGQQKTQIYSTFSIQYPWAVPTRSNRTLKI